MKIRMEFEKTTPGTVRYREVDTNGKLRVVGQGAGIGTLYIRKTAFSGPPAEYIEVSVLAEGGGDI